MNQIFGKISQSKFWSQHPIKYLIGYFLSTSLMGNVQSNISCNIWNTILMRFINQNFDPDIEPNVWYPITNQLLWWDMPAQPFGCSIRLTILVPISHQNCDSKINWFVQSNALKNAFLRKTSLWLLFVSKKFHTNCNHYPCTYSCVSVLIRFKTNYK